MELAGLHHAAVVQDQDAVVPAEERLVQGVGDHHPGEALQIQNRAGDAEGCLLIQGSSGLVHQKHGGVPQQTPGDGHPLALAAGEPRAVLPAEVALALLLDDGGKARKLLGPLDLLGRKVPEHGDVVPQGAVEHEHVLLHQGDQLVEGLGADGGELPAVVEDFPRVAAVARHKQIQQGGLPRAGSAHQGVAFPRLELGVYVVEHLLPLLVGEGEVPHLDALLQLFGDGRALLPDVLGEGVRQLVHKGQSRPAVGQHLGALLQEHDGKPAELEEHRGHARGDAIALQGQGGRHQEHPELGCHPRHAAQGAQHLGQAHPAALGLLGLGVALGEQPQNVLFGFEALHHGEAGEAVFDHREEAVVFPGDFLLPAGQVLARHQGGAQGQQGKHQGNQGEQGAVPEHHQKGAHAEDGVHHQVKELFQVIHLDTVGVVGEGGQVGGGALLGKGGDVLL